MSMRPWWSVLVAGILAVAAGLTALFLADRGLSGESLRVGGVPVEIVRGPAVAGASGGRPAVVVVHGYAGSGRLMRPFADTLARRGYVVLLPDLAGHGANTRRLDVPSAIDPEIAAVVAHARELPDVDPDRVTLLGHSMGAGAVVRAGAADPRIAATVAISLPGSGGAPGPRRLLLIVGALEPAGFRAAGEQTAREPASGDRPVGDRRLVSVPFVEHISVLYAPRTHREAAAWLDAAVGNTATGSGTVPLRRIAAGALTLLGALLLLTAALGRPSHRLTPPPHDAVSGPAGLDRAAALRRPAGWIAVGGAGLLGLAGGGIGAVAVPSPVTGYLIGYFAAVGGVLAIAAAALTGARRPSRRLSSYRPPLPRWTAVVASAGGGAAVVVPVQLGLTLMVPHGDRWWLVGALALATAALLAGARALAGPVWDLAVLAAIAMPLAAAAVIGLAPGFLLLIAPLVALLFVLYALLAAVARRGGATWWSPIAAGAVMIAWPVAVALPVSVG
ncbi:pimeloyl-ACP methyl ester carboxylesterase [Catenuloplanes nepalensis]|uniref:Pimeloyl-ACP methyl ester carboxylesterase n=1 Tax=Catenuloplanes nepalensis TaxID=587533 RepID=A0ABT9MW67_9ACTN|nr:alpha/beta fold hydrolase [Catenuloplanes nepalensis]MDP9795246.1 pimeloyl-ACP methyl ester carboxylesterase [Catenuloplanes nepalensis]